MSKIGQKHLIECNCILPQFRNQKKPIFHKFIVFSTIDENDKVVEKIVQCPNCGIVHKVSEIGNSEILRKENVKSVKTIKDLSVYLPGSIVGVLEAHNCDLPTYEEIEFIIENELWDSSVVISKELTDDGEIFGKLMIIKNQKIHPGVIKIESFSRDDTIR